MQGRGVSKGLCYAKALVLVEKPILFPSEKEEPKAELRKFMEAQGAVLERTARLREKVRLEVGEEAADILDTHCGMLEDEGLLNSVTALIADGTEASAAVEQALNTLILKFEAMENEYFAQRATDIKDIKERLIRRILNIDKLDISELSSPTILVGEDITPSATASADLKNVAGMLMEQGGFTSHTAILARALDIPAIVGAKGATSRIKTGDMIAIDGDSGKVFYNISEGERAEFINRMLAEQEKKKLLKELAKEPAETKNGVLLELYGNIGMPEEVDKILEYGGTGIGLFRSEYLYLASDTLPSEKQQFFAYKKLLESMGTKPTIVRTLDIGGDKDVPALALEKEENPFLGLRAIRLCQKRESVFKAQLRALLKASVYGNLHIMFPMISSLEELELCKEELRNEGAEYADKIPVGMMVEIPSVAIMADVFAKYCDFFSIGTNDLTQYTLAVDRGNETVSELFTYFHPSVIRMIKAAIEGAHQRGIPCGMCGEAAGDPKMIPLLIGMGLDEYSMTASSLPKAKALIRKLDSMECASLLEQVLYAETTSEVEIIVNQFINEKEIDLC